MSQDYYFLANRISNLEKHVEILMDIFNEISLEIRRIKTGSKSWYS